MTERLPDGSIVLPNHQWSWRRAAWRAYVEVLKRTDWPIIAGPFRGELGFEVLYWIPLINQLVKRHGIARERFVPLTRGGAAAWYGTPTGLELYGMRSVQDIRIQLRLDHARTQIAKQLVVSAFDRQLAIDAAQTIGARRYHVLHPAWMYHCLAPYWSAERGAEWLHRHVVYDRGLPTPPLPDSVTLPERFVAVRFYARRTFDPQRHNLIRSFIPAILEQITAEHDVILLDHDLFLDDHLDLTRRLAGPRISHLTDYIALSPETNLAVTSAVLARSQAFVGTYGGFAQLALRLQRPSVSFLGDWGATSIAHRALADIIAIRTNIPSIVLQLGELPLLHSLLPSATVAEATPLKT